MTLNTCNLQKLVLAACAAILVVTATATLAHAALVARFTMSTTTPHVGQLVTFNGSQSVCDSLQGCSYTWQWFWRSRDGATHLGGQMGRTPIIRYAFDGFAASKPYVIVTLTVAAGRLRRPSIASAAFRVLP